jgi:hypothetical protein
MTTLLRIVASSRPLQQLLRKKPKRMSTSILSTARNPTRIILQSIVSSRRAFTYGPLLHNQGSRGIPAAAVPNTPSPFQLTPETLKQQKVSEEVTRVPLNKRTSSRHILSSSSFVHLLIPRLYLRWLYVANTRGGLWTKLVRKNT